MAAVEIEGVSKSFGDLLIIDDVSISIPDGTFVVLVGPSGCGKSTLLRMLAGLESPSSGRILIGGRVMNQVAPKDRDIAMVFQSYALYPHMTVAENMGFSLRMRGVPKAEIARAVMRAAEILNLTDYLDRYPRQLSGGQRQRVAMGRSIVRAPDVFLFDEPLSNLDAKLRTQMRSEIRQLHQRLGNTMIYVTHDQVEAMTMADLIVVLQGGRVEQSGTPLELYDRPRNIFVAEFMGSPAMNMLRGRISGKNFIFANGSSVSLPGWVAQHDGRDAVMGVRPEHFKFVGREEHGLPAEVLLVEHMGSEIHLLARAGEQALQIAYREPLPGAAGEGIKREVHPYRLGEPIRLSPRHIHLFDAASGERI